MAKGWKIVFGVAAWFVCLSFLHAWLNVGFDKFRLGGAGRAENSFRVGFLPVT